MATRYTSKKAPGMAVMIGRGGVYIELEGEMIKLSSIPPVEIEEMVLEQFQVIDENITWADVDLAALHDQYNVS